MKLVDILLLEDDTLDIMDLQRSLDKTKIFYKLHVCRNGEEALDFLAERSDTGAQLPDIVLIDINMPKMNGLEFLGAIRANEKWKALRCFIITTSEEKVDKEAAKALGVSGYIVKPFKINNPSSMDSFNLMIDLMNM